MTLTFMYRDVNGLGRSCCRKSTPNYKHARKIASEMLTKADPINHFISVHKDGGPGLTFLFDVKRDQ